MAEELKLPLEGLRLIDLCDEKGVYCTKIFADLGADVIKVEKPGGDATRNIGPFKDDDSHPEKSLFFAYNNTNKKSITLNLNSADGQDIFKKLVRRSDTVMETGSPGYMASLGLDYSSLSKLNPELVMTSITGFGQTGPHRDFKSSDIVSFAMGGLMYQTGDADMPPLLAGGLQTYYVSSLFAAVATLTALYSRDATGQGQHVDVSIQECIATLLEVMCFYLYAGRLHRRRGARHLMAIPSDNYPCKDGYWSICVGPHSAVWVRLVAWMLNDGIDVGELANPEYEVGSKRWPVIDTKIDPIIKEWSRQYTKARIFDEGQRNDVAVAPVSTAKDVAEDPHLDARGFFEEVSHPVIGTAKYPGVPWRLPKGHMTRPAPLIGEHNREVYQALGLSNEDLIILKGAGVI
ncbi:MAG: CoA transferase [Dehalococcoidia bacterium]|nr:CoA transferase [Dehalococcoidia bacterium]